jgi:hypothetical protein
MAPSSQNVEPPQNPGRFRELDEAISNASEKLKAGFIK